MQPVSTNDLVGGVMSSREEVEVLFARDRARITRLVRAGSGAPPQLVEDACQVAWARLVQRRAQVRRETATAWLVRTAINEAYAQMRRTACEWPLEALEDDERARCAGPAPALLDELVEQRARLQSIRALPERQQRLVWLQGLGLSYREMAGHTGATRRTVERQLLRAHRTLASQAA